MRKLFSNHKGFIGLGLMSALVVALAVLGTLWGFSQSASANGPLVTLVHVEPSGADYTGNPYCPDTIWTGTKKPVVNPWHDCNNITSQNHVIRTAGWADTLGTPVWNIENFSGAVATIQAQGRCGDIQVGNDKVSLRPNWNLGQCGSDVDDDGDTRVNDGCPTVGAAPEDPACANAIDDDVLTDTAETPRTVNDGCPVKGTAETACADAIDDDGDTNINDGCPMVGAAPENPSCVNALDDDADTIKNDGCPAKGVSEDPDDQQCVVLHSSTPGETRVTLSYSVIGDGTFVAGPVMKEWDSLTDSVILKYGDGDLEKVKVYYGGTTLYKELYLPPDVNGDTVRDTDDEHLLDKQSKWQDHPVIWDEAVKRIKALPPVEITEVVHGEHWVLINSVSVKTHQPTEGALILAEIESPRYCTFFTDSTGTLNFGATVAGVSDNLGRLVFPAGGLGVYVDTVCEEQAEIHFYAQYPNLPGSLRLGLHEWIGINWTTIEQAKQPQIRWAGEEIILAKRWALPDDWYPNVAVAPATGYLPYCPLASNFNATPGGDFDDLVAQGHLVSTDNDAAYEVILDYSVDYQRLANSTGALKGQYADNNNDGVLDTLNTDEDDEGEIDRNCITKGLYDSENPGQVDVEALLLETRDVCSPIPVVAPLAAWIKLQSGGVACYDPAANSGAGAYGTVTSSTELINKHAFLVWYLKIYQTKLTNVDGERADHNAGAWTFGDGEDTEADTLNVSADTLLRVKVKGWFFSEDLSGRGAVCIDMDGDGNGLEGEEASEPGVPYPLTNEDVGCVDTGDEMLENGHWVLPDDLPLLAGPDAINTRPNWDVMSEADAASTGAIGPKSALDSHDATLRSWVGRKSVVPDGAITAADAIMPPLKIRASIAADDAGYLKQALKGVDIYSGTNDYHSSMLNDREIPAVVNNGGYDWMSWTMPSCPDADFDGVCNAVDKCPAVFDPTNGDLDSDGIGDVCDDDADGDTDLNAADNCPLTINANQADADSDGIGDACDTAAGMDSDGDTVPDATDNCDTKKNDTQVDTDGDGYGDACDANPSVRYWDVAPTPYPFWTILYKLEREDPDEAVPALKKRPWYIEFYTDNRGEGMFFANGDFMLSYDDCRADPVSGAPDCSPGKVVGNSTITVIGDYPYFRKHSAVLSNPVEKTWEWGGFKDVEAVRIDANHTAIIAHLVDRDGFCKYDVGSDPTAAKGVTTSPSLHPVQGEAIEFILNTDIGRIIEVSPNGVYQPPAPHAPLTDARVVRLEDGVIIDRSEAVALAEDGRVLGYFDEARGIDEGLVAEEDCQAWIVIEHPLGEEPNVSVRFHDPEGVILRHWPPSELTVSLVQYWNDSCYAGPSQPVEEAMADIIDNVLAVYRYTADQTWEGYFPGRCEEAEGLCTIETLEPYDQLFILMSASADWLQVIQAPPTSADLVEAWNSICYTGTDKATEEATWDIESAFAIMYQLGSDQAWRRYVPARPEIPDTLTTLHMFDSVVLLVTTEGGITWTFDP
jgi:hypothetical protein